MINAGSSSADGAGASKGPHDIANTVGLLPDLVEALTGIDVVATLKSMPVAETPDPRSTIPPEAENASIKKSPTKAAVAREKLNTGLPREK